MGGSGEDALSNDAFSLRRRYRPTAALRTELVAEANRVGVRFSAAAAAVTAAPAAPDLTPASFSSSFRPPPICWPGLSRAEPMIS